MKHLVKYLRWGLFFLLFAPGCHMFIPQETKEAHAIGLATSKAAVVKLEAGQMTQAQLVELEKEAVKTWQNAVNADQGLPAIQEASK